MLCANEPLAQTIQTKLDQVELMKQFIGNWKAELGKDTTALWNFKSYGTGLDCYITYVTNGKIFKEVRSLYGYDKKVDKFIAASMVKGKDLEIFAIWFLSNRNYEIIYYSDISNPDKASIKNEGEINSSDKLIVTKIINNKPVSTLTYTRVK